MKRFLTQTLQTALNKLLQLDPASAKRMSRLQSKVIMVELRPLSLNIQLLFNDHSIFIQEDAALQADVIIRGTPLQIASLALNQQEKQRYFAEDITIEGNAELAQDMLHLFSDLHIDWEEIASQFIGDTAAYHASKWANRSSRWLRNLEQSLTADVADYIKEEAQWFPTREALQDLFNDIDYLKMDVDRIEAKILQFTTAALKRSNK